MADETQAGESKGVSVPVIIVLVLIVIGGVYVWKHKEAKAPIEEVAAPIVEGTSTAPVIDASMKLASERSAKIVAGAIGAPVESVTTDSVTAKDWPDTCLGLPKADEMCAQTVTPGYEVVLEAQKVKYTYRTDKLVNQIRIQK